MLKDSLEVRGQRGFFIQEQEATEQADKQQQAGSSFRDIQMRSQMKNHLDFLFSLFFSLLLFPPSALIANMKYRGRRKVKAAAALQQQQQRDITNICPSPETVVERDDVIKGRRRGPELVGGPLVLLGDQWRKNPFWGC